MLWTVPLLRIHPSVMHSRNDRVQKWRIHDQPRAAKNPTRARSARTRTFRSAKTAASPAAKTRASKSLAAAHQSKATALWISRKGTSCIAFMALSRNVIAMVQAQGLQSRRGASAAEKGVRAPFALSGFGKRQGPFIGGGSPGDPQEAKRRATRKLRSFAFGHLTKCYPGDSNRLRSVECQTNVILPALAND